MTGRSAKFYHVALTGIILIILCAGLAGTVLIPKQPPLSTTAPLHCEQSTLTSKTFMDQFHTIVMHGDLWDIPFLEEALQTKFQKLNSLSDYREEYKADSVLNAPVTVFLAIIADAEHKKYRVTLKFGYNNFLPGCLRVAVSQFESYFGSGFNRIVSTDGLETSGGKTLNGAAENPKIGVGYIADGNKNDSIISEAIITQHI